MVESIKIVRWCLAHIEPGPVLGDIPKVLRIPPGEAYVGIENCVRPEMRRRWRLTFLFGLVHGFGFAGALREVALSAVQIPLALASFNVGVEAGQLAVLAVVLPLVSWLGGRAWFAGRGVQVASIAISAIGLCWFVVRVTG